MPSKAATKKPVETPVVEVAPVDKKSKSTKAAAPAPAPAPATVKKDTKPRTKKETTPVVDTPVEVQNVVVATDATETSITDNFSEFIQKFQGMLSSFSSLKTALKNLERKTIKQLKVIRIITRTD